MICAADPSALILGGTLISVVLSLLVILLLIAWVFLPFLLYSKLGKIERVLREMHALEISKLQEQHAPPRAKQIVGLPPGIVRGP